MIKFKYVPLIAIAAIAASANAAPVAGVATLAAPARSVQAVTPAGVWQCSESTCTGMTVVLTGEAVGVCTAVADSQGRVTAFTAGATTFKEGELARCNRHLKP